MKRLLSLILMLAMLRFPAIGLGEGFTDVLPGMATATPAPGFSNELPNSNISATPQPSVVLPNPGNYYQGEFICVNEAYGYIDRYYAQYDCPLTINWKLETTDYLKACKNAGFSYSVSNNVYTIAQGDLKAILMVNVNNAITLLVQQGLAMEGIKAAEALPELKLGEARVIFNGKLLTTKSISFEKYHKPKSETQSGETLSEAETLYKVVVYVKEDNILSYVHLAFPLTVQTMDKIIISQGSDAFYGIKTSYNPIMANTCELTVNYRDQETIWAQADYYYKDGTHLILEFDLEFPVTTKREYSF